MLEKMECGVNYTTEILRENVNNLIDQNVSGIKSLGSLTLYDGMNVSANGFYVDTVVGGGNFVYDASKDKADHNGGTVIAPEAIAAWDGSQVNLTQLLNWAGTGSGCFVRSKSKIEPYFFGAIGDGVVDDSDSLIASYKTGSSVHWDGSKTYVLSKSNELIFNSGQHTFGGGANLIIKAGTTISDATGDGFGRFDNNAFKINTANAFTKNTIFCDLNFTCLADKVNAIGGIHSLIRTSNTGELGVLRCTLNGKGTASGLGGHATPTYTDLGAFCYLSGISCNISNNEISDSGNGIMVYAGLSVKIEDNSISYCGVSRDFSSWNNQSAVDAKGMILEVRRNRVLASGGSSFFLRRTSGSEAANGIKEIYFEDNIGIGCGLSFCGAGTRSFSEVASIDIISYKGNKVFGWLCAIDGIEHTCSAISLEDAFSSKISKVVTGGNILNYLAPWESYNSVTNQIDGSYNPFKSANKDHGNQYGLLISTGALGVISSHVNDSHDVVLNHDTLGVGILDVLKTNSSFRCVNNGWQRNSSGNAYQIQQSVRVSKCSGVVKAEIYNHAMAVNKNTSFTTPVYIQDFDGSVDILVDKTGASQRTGQTVRYVQTVSGNSLDISNFRSDCRLEDAGHVYTIDTSSGTYSKTSKMTWGGATVVNYISGGRSLDVSVGTIMQATGSATPLTEVIPYAASMTGRRVDILKVNNTMTISPTGLDLINGLNASVTLLATESGNLYSDGVSWHFVKR